MELARTWSRHRHAVTMGSAVGLVALAFFLVIHAIIITPIWRAIPQGIGIALYGGVLMGLVHARLRRLPTFRNGLLLGGLAALWLMPFLVGGALRTAGQPATTWALALAALALAWLLMTHLLVRRAGGDARDTAYLTGAVVLLTILPMLFLTFITNFHALPVQPIPMTLAVAGIYIASGAALGWTIPAARE